MDFLEADDDSQRVAEDDSQGLADDDSQGYMICEYDLRTEKWHSLLQTIDNIYNYLEELENQGDFTMHAENQIQYLKFDLRNSRIHFKWGRLIDDPFLNQISSWVEDVADCLLQPARKGCMTPGLLEETLSKLWHGVILMKKELFREGCDIQWIVEDSSFSCYKNAFIADVLEWIDQLLDNLKCLIRWNNHRSVVPEKEKIENLVEKVGFLRNFLKIAGMELKESIENGSSVSSVLHKASDLFPRFRWFIYKATCMSWYSLDDREHRLMDMFFLISLGNIDLVEPELRLIYVQLVKASKISNQETLGIDLQALAAIDSLLDNLQKLLKDQDNGSFKHFDVHKIEILCQELGFLKYFLMDPHVKQHDKTEAQNFMSFLTQVEIRARELGASLTLSNCFGQIEDHLADELLKLVKLLKIKIREMYQSIPRQSTSNFPRSPKLGFVDFCIQNLEELLLHRADSVAYVENEVRTLQSELILLNTFIGDTTNNLERDENIARRIMDFAYEAQQVIDLISSSHFFKWYYILWLSDIIENIKTLKKDCLEIHSKMTTESNNVVNTSSTIIPNRGYNLAIEEEIVGFQAEAEKIIDQLTRGTEHLDVVSIVGMPGLGKTTLAKKVYEHPSIARYFHIRSWYCISQEYDRQDLLCSILNDLSQMPPARNRAQELYKSLKGRTYLIVLDDIWSIEPWNDIRNSFPDDCNGSRILFTSRMREVALQANPRSAPPHDLRLLSNEESWELLHNKVFKERNYPPEIYTIGKKIAVNCKGLPLSVVLVAGVLVKLEESEDHWKQVLSSLSKQVGDLSKCILELSYKQLPDHLKPCFLYFGAFPEDKAILTWKLFRLWIAEGFIQKKTNDESLENVAEGYLMDLIVRNLVLIAESKSIGGVKSCHVHDLLHEFSKEKVKDENFLLISKKMPYDQLGQYRQCFYFNKKSLRGWIPCNPYVRSIFLYLIGERGRICSDGPLVLSYSLKLLTILNLQGISFSNDQFQRMTEVLVNLRYLAIEGLEHVPSSVANLWRLETFIFIGIDFVTLPEALLEMEYLKYVYVYVGLSCDITLPDHTAESMSRLSFKASGIEKFSKPSFDHRTMEKVIRRLRSLRKLKCRFFENFNENGGHFPELNLLSELESLNMTYVRDSERMITLSENSFPSNLKKLTLSGLCLPWSEISKIRRLPQLKVLKLCYDAFKGQRWDANDDDEVWNLKFLKLELLDIEEWDASPDAFPFLEKLVVVYCKRLKEIPSSFGESGSLQMIEVKGCLNSVNKAVLKIEKEQHELGATGFKLLIQDPFPELDPDLINLFFRVAEI